MLFCQNEGIDLYKKLKSRFGKAQVDLCKFRTNSQELYNVLVNVYI